MGLFRTSLGERSYARLFGDVPASPYDWPAAHRAVVQSVFTLTPRNVALVGAWGGKTTVAGPYVRFWQADLTPPTVPGNQDNGEQLQLLEGFLTRLAGMRYNVRLVDYFRQKPLYSKKNPASPLAATVELAEDAAVEATSLLLTGLPADTLQVFGPDDRFEIKPGGWATTYGNYYKVQDYADANGDGEVRIYIDPPLRQTCLAADAVVLNGASCVFRLRSDDVGRMTRLSGQMRGNYGLSLDEVLPG